MNIEFNHAKVVMLLDKEKLNWQTNQFILGMFLNLLLGLFDSEIPKIDGIRFQESIPDGFNSFSILVFLDRRNLISPWLQAIKVIENRLSFSIIWSSLCIKKNKKTIHFYSSNWFTFFFILSALPVKWIIAHCSAWTCIYRMNWTRHELYKINVHSSAKLWSLLWLYALHNINKLHWNKITITLKITLIELMV